MKYLVIISLLFCSLLLNAQSGYVQKLYAFSEKNPAANNYLIYIELSADQTPVWDSAVIEGSLFVVHHSLVERTPLQVGERKKDGRMVVIKPQPGNKLYKLDFDLVEENTNAKDLQASEPILLKGSFKNRRISRKVSSTVELVPIIQG